MSGFATNPTFKRYQQRAREQVSKAIKRGELVKQSCQLCGSIPTDAHHEDYSKPLEVIWLCKSHHMQFRYNPTYFRQCLGITRKTGSISA